MAKEYSQQQYVSRYDAFRTDARSYLQAIKTNFAAGTDEQRNAIALKGLWSNCAVWRRQVQVLQNAITADPTLSQYFKDQLADQTYDVAAVTADIRAQCGAIMTYVDGSMPKSGVYWAMLRVVGEDLEWRMFTPTALAPLHQDPPAEPHLLHDLIQTLS